MKPLKIKVGVRRPEGQAVLFWVVRLALESRITPFSVLSSSYCPQLPTTTRPLPGKAFLHLSVPTSPVSVLITSEALSGHISSFPELLLKHGA